MNFLNFLLQVFGSSSDPRVYKLCASIQYFLNGTQGGFLRYQKASSTSAYSSLYGTEHLHATRKYEHFEESYRQDSLLLEPNDEKVDQENPENPISPHSVPSTVSLQSLSSSTQTPSMSDTLGPSTLQQFLASSASLQKVRTRRHNSVPLLRNIPIICETVEEDVTDAGAVEEPDCVATGVGNNVYENEKNPGVCATRSSLVLERTVQRRYSAGPADETSGVSRRGSNGILSRSLTHIGKRLTCPAIKVTDDESEENGVSVGSIRPSSSVHVPQIVIEVSEPAEGDENEEVHGRVSLPPEEEDLSSGVTRGFRIPSIDITSVEEDFKIPSIDITSVDDDNDDTDVEVDLEEVGREEESYPLLERTIAVQREPELLKVISLTSLI